MSRKKHQSGFGLIEILVATVVLALGMLGIAGLQLNTMKNSHSSGFRSQATILTYGIIDAMRANRDAALAGDYDIAFAASAPGGATIPDVDIRHWLSSLENVLPASDGEISRSGSEFTVSVSWDDSRGTEAAKVFSVTTML